MAVYNPGMSDHPTNIQGSVTDAIRDAIASNITDAQIEVSGGGGHYTITVISTVFEGKRMLESQRLVYSAISHLMAGDNAPVHAVDKLSTKTP